MLSVLGMLVVIVALVALVAGAVDEFIFGKDVGGGSGSGELKKELSGRMILGRRDEEYNASIFRKSIPRRSAFGMTLSARHKG